MDSDQARIAMLRIKHEGDFFIMDTPEGELYIHRITARILIEYIRQHLEEKSCQDISFSAN